jgi:mannose-6-phosphate isomerase-like protein (cupin superfamily)
MPALHRIPARPLDIDELVGVVRTMATDATRWRPLLRFPPRSRWWSRLHGDDLLDVWLETWPSREATDLHDHGDSAAAYAVLAGALVEIRVRPGGQETRCEVPAGQAVWIPPGVVHDVTNARPVHAVSIHAYSPPLRSMTFYRPGPKGLTPVRRQVPTAPGWEMSDVG